MLLPSNSILLWRDPVDVRQKDGTTFVSLLFDYHHNGSSLLVSLKRPVDEPFSETAKKIEFKMQKMTMPKMNKAVSSLPTAEPSPFRVEIPELNGDLEKATLEEVVDSVKLLTVGSVPFTIVREPADISSITCALKPLAGCPIYPAVDFRQGLSAAKPTFHWYVYNSLPNLPGRTDEKAKIVASTRETIELIEGPSRRFSVSNCEYRWTGSSYVPSAFDSGKSLFIVADLGPEAIVKSGISKFPVETIDEPLIFEENTKWCQSEKPSECFRVVSYNILADLYLDLSGAQEELFFPYCPKSYQMYEYRYPLLLRELSGYDADLCFLQEVDHRMQMRYLDKLFESLGLEMNFARKQKEVTEGSVIAFRRDRFTLLHSGSYGLASLLEHDISADIRSMLSTSATSQEIFVSRPTTIQIVVLRDQRYNDIIVCGNSHLHHSPRHEHLKAFQAAIAVRQLDKVRREFSALYPQENIRLLFAGDFNSTPDGPVYELISTGFLSKSSTCWKLDENLVVDDLKLLPCGTGLTNLTGTEPTNFTCHKGVDGKQRGFSGCLDYVWSDSTAILHRMAPRPTQELLTKYDALPSKIAPSDHIPLICDIRFEQN
ncbi:hypothetical protein Q1695_015074 [Nippostrongylus brasiliensis]|nr:hypothetical protein Q1695_015074 [Nippostrongylus brasiliensis]